MSIIHEALKKTQNQIEQRETSASATTSAKEGSNQPLNTSTATHPQGQVKDPLRPPEKISAALAANNKGRSSVATKSISSTSGPVVRPQIILSTLVGCSALIILFLYLANLHFLQGNIVFTIPDIKQSIHSHPPQPLATLQSLASQVTTQEQPLALEPLSKEVVQSPLTPAPIQAEASKPPIPELKLSGIVTDQNKRFALINGKIVQTGDTIEGKQIVNILENQVEIIDNDQKVILILPQ